VPLQRILGHDSQRQAFARAVRSGRLAHAYLFAGPPGIGKRPFAVELARNMLCEQPSADLEACDHCGSCKLVAAGNHPDFFAVARPEDKNELPIDTMRDLCNRFALKSARGRGKIALLENADDLNAESANCFLKTLEEPPPRSVFFLIGTDPERQFPTVVSRCQVIRFSALPDDFVERILRSNGITDQAILRRLVLLGHGSPGEALALADPDLWKYRKLLIEGLLRPRPNSVDLGKELLTFVEAAGKERAPQRRRASLMLRLLIEFFSDALAVSLGANPRLNDAEDLANLGKLASRVSPDRMLQLIERCLEADVQIGRYIQLVLVLEALLDALGAALSAK
jgi:DNA polymerase III subunit delta'